MDATEKKFARVKGLSTILDLAPSTIWDLVKKGVLPKPKKVTGHITLFDVPACVAALKEQGE